MDNKQIFEKYYSRLVKEGIIKALICGIIVAFSLSLVSAIVTLLASYDGLWISIGIGIAVTAAAAPLFYFKMFRPTIKKVAERVDRLGLDERLVTMLELQNNESFIAMRQREDAKAKLGSVNHKRVRFSFLIAPLIVVGVLTLFAGSMTAVSTLKARGFAGWLPDSPFKRPVDDDEFNYLDVTYLANEGGYIEGEAEQSVFRGEDSTMVVAIAHDGYAFSGWSDGRTDPERFDINIQEELSVTAQFEEMQESSSEAQSQGGEPEEGTEPPEPSEQPPEETPPEETPPDGGGGTKPNDKIIDNEIDYRAVYQQYYELAMQIIAEGGELPAHLKRIIEAYFDILQI